MFIKSDEDENISRNSRKLYPDFYKENFILDAKYKHLNSGVGREDLFQVVSYMYCRCAKHGGLLFPNEENSLLCNYQLMGYNGYIHLFPFMIPQEAMNYGDFVKQIQNSETKLTSLVNHVE
jgi:5-methylcytosine-specific restriction endonuclease McrBC regulatory subunit McrC